MGVGDQSFRERVEFGSTEVKKKGNLCRGNRVSKGRNCRAGSGDGAVRLEVRRRRNRKMT